MAGARIGSADALRNKSDGLRAQITYQVEGKKLTCEQHPLRDKNGP